jgi:phospholipase C
MLRDVAGRMNSRRFGALFVIELVLAAALVLLAAQLLSDSAEKSPPIRPEVPTEDSPSTGPRGPIEKVVIIVKENRTFDNMFGHYPGADGYHGRYLERLRGSPETGSRSLPARHRPQLPSRAHGGERGRHEWIRSDPRRQ